jgi:hypothetical protein
MDFFHKIILLLAKKEYSDNQFDLNQIKSEFGNYKNDMIDLIKKRYQLESCLKAYHIHTPPEKCGQDLLAKLLVRLPVTDISRQWQSEKNIDSTLKSYFDKPLSNPNNQKYINWARDIANLSTVDRLKFIATKGMGAHLLDADNCIDLSYMYQFKVRPKFVPYGAKLLNATNMTDTARLSSTRSKFSGIAIELPYTPIFKKGKISEFIEPPSIFKPNSENWQFAYNMFVASLLTHVTVADHALECHIILSNNVATLCMCYYDRINHSILNLLKPFVFKTNSINQKALDILICKGGIINRIFGFTKQSMENFYEYHINSYRYTGIHDLAETEFKRDAIKYWNVIEKFVSDYIDDVCPDEIFNVDHLLETLKYIPGMVDDNKNTRSNLIRVLTVHIFNVTIWHEQIGNMTMYIINPKILRSKVYKKYPNAICDSRQNTLQTMNLTLVTSVVSMPKINDELYKIFPPRTQHKDIWESFRHNINNLQLECEHLHPSLIETSVSL